MGRKKLAMTAEERKAHVRKLAAKRQQKRRANMSKEEKKKSKKSRQLYKKDYLSRPGNLQKQRQYERDSRARACKAGQDSLPQASRNLSLLDKLWLFLPYRTAYLYILIE